MKDVKWISISTDIFNNEKMCAIESMPDGTSIELVWLKLLCLAGTCNENGCLMITKDVPYTDEMLAKYFRMDIGIIKRALETFQELEMVEVIDNIYMVSNWMKYQNTSQLEHMRLLHNERQKRYREKQKLHLEQKSDVTSDENKSVIVDDFCSICNMSYVDVYKEVINYLNSKTNKNYKYSTKKNQVLIHARCEEGNNLENFKTVIDKKCEEWIGTEWEKYLRPETLFGTKFEGYLNQPTKKQDDNNFGMKNIKY